MRARVKGVRTQFFFVKILQKVANAIILVSKSLNQMYLKLNLG